MKLKNTTKMSAINNPKTNTLYSDYIAYRCQLSLYKLWNSDGTLSWEKFITVLHDSEKLRNTAKAVIENTLLSFDPNAYDFEISHRVQFFEEREEADVILAAQIFDEEEGEFLIHLFMLQTQVSHLEYLSKLGGFQYKWKNYIQDVLKNDVLKVRLIRAYQQALISLDFEKCWMMREPAKQ